MDKLYEYFEKYNDLSEDLLVEHKVSNPIDILYSKFPCRNAQITELYNLFQDNLYTVDYVYLHGCTSTGKSEISSAVLNFLNIKHVIVNLNECYTAKILFEKILNSLANCPVDPKSGQPYKKCDNLMDFIINVKQLHEDIQLDSTVIILDKAERLRDMDMNLLPAFTKFHELSKLNISFILISELEFSQLVSKDDVASLIEIYFPQYFSDELVHILVNDFVNNNVLSTVKLVVKNEKPFYKSYLSAFMSVFYWICRDLCELRYLSKKNFGIYCQPILNDEICETDFVGLWKNIVPFFKTDLHNVYLRMNSSLEEVKNSCASLDNQNEISTFQANKKSVQSLELPFYAKFLLIAAYLASYNPTKEDKRLFMKFHGKKRKTRTQMTAKTKVSEQLNTQIGPKPFTFDRLLAIFYAILDDKVGLNSNLLVQVSSLVQLQLLSAIGDNTSLDNQKYKCNVNYEFIEIVAKMVGFDIRNYLYDFI